MRSHPPRQLLLATISSVALLTGCATVPVPDHPTIGITLPEDWTSPEATSTEDSDSASRRNWWEEMGDSTLTQLVVEGLQQNRDLMAASERVLAVAAQAKMSGASRLPHVSAGTGVSRSRRNFIGFPIGGAGAGVVASTTTTYNADLLVSWELDLWGRMRAGHTAALADVAAAQADLAGARLSIAAQLARLYFGLIEAHNQLDLALATAASLQQTAQQIEDRYQRGLRTSLDLRLARSSAATAQAVVTVRRAQLDATTRQLEVMLGRYPAAALKTSRDLPPLVDAIPAGLPVDLVSRRPDLAAGERRLVAADLRVNEARRALLPRISLTASGGRSSDALADLLDGDYSVWNLVSNLSQPLFQGGRLRAQVERAAAGRDAALAEYAAAALRAFSEVETALTRERLLTRQEAQTHIAATEARAAEQVATERYNRGLSSYIALLESQRRAFDAQSQLLSVRRQRLDARVELHLALGGGFILPNPSAPHPQ